VPGRDGGVRPADLFEDLADNEGFDEVAVVGEGRGISLCDFLRCEVQQPCHHAGINDVHLRMAGGADAESGAPCGQSLNEEHRFKQFDVVLRRGFLQAGDAADRGDVEDLARPGG
jgi:hypothetical protein